MKGTREMRQLDPFLMLDYFKVRLPAGFPDHPHRGFETVTYMLSGTFFHEDFKGNAVRNGIFYACFVFKMIYLIEKGHTFKR